MKKILLFVFIVGALSFAVYLCVRDSDSEITEKHNEEKKHKSQVDKNEIENKAPKVLNKATNDPDRIYGKGDAFVKKSEHLKNEPVLYCLDVKSLLKALHSNHEIQIKSYSESGRKYIAIESRFFSVYVFPSVQDAINNYRYFMPTSTRGTSPIVFSPYPIDYGIGDWAYCVDYGLSSASFIRRNIIARSRAGAGTLYIIDKELLKQISVEQEKIKKDNTYDKRVRVVASDDKDKDPEMKTVTHYLFQNREDKTENKTGLQGETLAEKSNPSPDRLAVPTVTDIPDRIFGGNGQIFKDKVQKLKKEPIIHFFNISEIIPLGKNFIVKDVVSNDNGRLEIHICERYEGADFKMLSLIIYTSTEDAIKGFPSHVPTLLIRPICAAYDIHPVDLVGDWAYNCMNMKYMLGGYATVFIRRNIIVKSNVPYLEYEIDKNILAEIDSKQGSKNSNNKPHIKVILPDGKEIVCPAKEESKE